MTMKKKQKEEIEAKSVEELVKEIEKRQGEISRLRIDVRMARVKDVSSLKRKTDELAVVKTILGEKKAFGKDKIE